jgi:hypothetical protein
MSYDASLRSCGYEQSITAKNERKFSRVKGWRAGTRADSAPSQLENETQLAMDRLLRECLTRKPPWE